MARKNRVNPFGELCANDSRGTLMGNRGCLHDEHGNVTKFWSRKQWIICLLSFKNRRRTIMSPGNYTELFFLDEATALSAGHRPCNTCQKDKYQKFKETWQVAISGGVIVPIKDIDSQLHKERYVSTVNAKTWAAYIQDLASGTIFLRNDENRGPWLLWGGKFFRWTFNGYCDEQDATNELVSVVTPKSVVSVLKAGYSPSVHDSIIKGSTVSSLNVKDSDAPVDKKQNKVKRPSKKSKINVANKKLHKLSITPSGRELSAYFAAILRVTGMDVGKSYQLNKFVGNFSGHIQAGRIEKTESGYRLTKSGKEYFNSRLEYGNPQYVDLEHVRRYEKQIHQGGRGWVAIE